MGLQNFVRLLDRPAQRWRIRQARKQLKVLRGIQGANAEARALAYLREVDPYVFECMVLLSLRKLGCGVLFSTAVSGDGGIDGEFWWPGWGWGAVQAKRYKGHISAQAVDDFTRLVLRRRYVQGFFVHTGRTGEKSWETVAGTRVQMVSGHRLLMLLREARLA